VRISYISLPTAPSPTTPNVLIIGAIGRTPCITVCHSKRQTRDFIERHVDSKRIKQCLNQVDNSSLPENASSTKLNIQGFTAFWLASMIEGTAIQRPLPRTSPCILYADVTINPESQQPPAIFTIAFLTPDGHPVVYICYTRKEAKRILRTRLHESLADEAETTITSIEHSRLPRKARPKTLHIGGHAATIIASTLMPR